MFPRDNTCRVWHLHGTKRVLLPAALALGIYVQLFHFATISTGQDALRSSFAGQQALEARKRAVSAQYYNIKVGNLALQLGTQLRTEFNDNVYYEETNPRSDLIFRPQLNVLSAFALTDKNSLNLSLGVGYAKYLSNSDLDSLFLAPGSDLSFDVYVRDFAINFHDRFTLSQDVIGQQTYYGVSGLNQFENTIGVLVNWDLNKALLTTGYDHYTCLSLTERYNYLTRDSELFFGRAVFAVNPTTWAGLELGGGFTAYEQNLLNNLTHVSAGGLLMWRSSEYLALRLAAGYVLYFAETRDMLGDLNNAQGFYTELSLHHRVNPKINYALRGGRRFQSGVLANLLDLYYLGLWTDWNVIQRWRLTTSFSFEHGTEAGPGFSETADRLGAEINLKHSLSPKLSANVSYGLYYKASSQRFNEYTQNRLVFDLSYRF